MLDRGRWLAVWRLSSARMLAGRSETYRRLQKQTLNQKMRRRILEGVPYGMALEGLTAARLGRS